MIEEIDIDCPYCGETNVIAVDVLAGDQSGDQLRVQRYTEDCVVCCQPIAISVAIDAESGVPAVSAEAENT